MHEINMVYFILIRIQLLYYFVLEQDKNCSMGSGLTGPISKIQINLLLTKKFPTSTIEFIFYTIQASEQCHFEK